MGEMIEIDGSRGEGGGQILRSALTLSLATGKPFRMVNVRGNRPKPGLLAQHLACIQAAERVGSGRATGARLRARKFSFEPGTVEGGEYEFRVGTAGSAGLVLQTVLPVLVTAPQPSRLTLEGGTHNPASPPFEFLDRVFLPLLRRVGANVSIQLERFGFFPAGGGQYRVEIASVRTLQRLELIEPVTWGVSRVLAVVSRLPETIAERELRTVRTELSVAETICEIITVERPRGPGNVVMIELEAGDLRELVIAFGRKGAAAEQVAREACREAAALLNSAAPIGPHLADQVLLLLALGRGGRFLTSRPTRHTHTNAETMQMFLNRDIRMDSRHDGLWEIQIDPSPVR